MKKGTVSVLSALLGAAISAAEVGKKMGEKIKDNKELADKHLALFLMMNKWVKIKQEGKNLADYFERNEYREIAIYGMSYAGETLVDELEGSNVKIKYGIDQRAGSLFFEFDIVSPDSKMENVDAVVVTPIKSFDEIKTKLSAKVKCPIIMLEDILYEV